MLMASTACSSRSSGMPRDAHQESSEITAAGRSRNVSLRLQRMLLITVYCAIACGPLIVAMLVDTRPPDPLVSRIGRMLALLGLPILTLQPVLSARLKIVDRAFGLDAVYIFHKIMAMVAGSLLVAHPVVLASANHWRLLTSFQLPWFITIGKIGLLALVVIILISLLQTQIRLRYEQWRATHNVLACVIVTVGFVHSMNIGADLSNAVMRTIWITLAVLAAISYGWHKVIGPHYRRKHSFSIINVSRESHNVWTLKMATSDGTPCFSFHPGQFQFISFHSGSRQSEEHPFTISSSPDAPGFHSATIKESGDFTAAIGSVKPGDLVGIQGPFGRFSYCFYPEEHDMVFIAGGIGITPFMSMLRHMRDTASDNSVTLFYANRGEQDIVFRDELNAIATGAHPRLKVVHVLSNAEPSWPGEKGRVTMDMIRRHVAELNPDKAFYICGSPVMMRRMIADLIKAGVRSAKVRAERFEL